MPVVSRLAGCFKRLVHGSSMRLPVMTRLWGLVGLVLGCVHHQHVTTKSWHHESLSGAPFHHFTFPPSNILSILSSAFYTYIPSFHKLYKRLLNFKLHRKLDGSKLVSVSVAGVQDTDFRLVIVAQVADVRQ